MTARFELSIRYRSNEQPFSMMYPGRFDTEDRVREWAADMAEGLGDEYDVQLFIDGRPAPIIATSQSEAIRAEVIAQGVDPNSDKAERMGRAMRQNMLRKAEGK